MPGSPPDGKDVAVSQGGTDKLLPDKLLIMGSAGRCLLLYATFSWRHDAHRKSYLNATTRKQKQRKEVTLAQVLQRLHGKNRVYFVQIHHNHECLRQWLGYDHEKRPRTRSGVRYNRAHAPESPASRMERLFYENSRLGTLVVEGTVAIGRIRLIAVSSTDHMYPGRNHFVSTPIFKFWAVHYTGLQ